MRHYEIVAVIHPDQHQRAGEMVERYKQIIAGGGGVVHRFEDWGLRPLAYAMNKQKRAQYLLFNVECDDKTLDALRENFRFSEAVMRSLVVRREVAVTGPSPILLKDEEDRIRAAEAAKRAEEEAKTDRGNKGKNGKDGEAAGKDGKDKSERKTSSRAARSGKKQPADKSDDDGRGEKKRAARKSAASASSADEGNSPSEGNSRENGKDKAGGKQ